MAILKMTQRRVAGAGLAVVLVYTLWIGWPYLESIVVRDAAVTSWISVTAAPINGYTTNPLYPGARVGSDGRIATITDERADQRDLTKTRVEHLRAVGIVATQEAVVDALKRGNPAFQDSVDARIRLNHAEAMLTQYRAERDAMQAVLDATQRAYDRSRALDIRVPRNAMVWSLISGPGAPVQAGAPVASWVDCSVMLVDVPLSDVEIALLHPGATAEVVLEGERKVRQGSVLLTRGSAGTLGSHDLAAISRARRPGLGQAIVKLEPSADDIRTCPIGHAAYVDFPGVGIFQILRARLRL